jgi:glycosyltransferase involved in cell wall biosynthesis
MSTKFYDLVITDAEAMRQVYLKEFGKDTTVIAYGATLRQSQNPELIQKWGLESNKYYLIVGRLIPDNNADIIIDGFLKSNSNLKLVVVGDVPYKDEYANRIKSIQDPKLLFTGYVNDPNELAELYHHCFVYFHGHEFGGTNPTLLKAMAYGAAVAALDTVFSREVLQNENLGYYFTKDTNSIITFIEAAEGKNIDIQGRKNRIREGISSNYHWDTIATLYLSAIEEIISKKKM